jgi:hypothetical protein
MVSVAPVEITTEGGCHLGVAGVVGGIQDEFTQRLEVAFDAIQVARRGGGGDQLNVVECSPLANQRRPVQRQVVVDEVDAQMIGITPADLLIDGQHLMGGLGQAIAANNTSAWTSYAPKK